MPACVTCSKGEDAEPSRLWLSVAWCILLCVACCLSVFLHRATACMSVLSVSDLKLLVWFKLLSPVGSLVCRPLSSGWSLTAGRWSLRLPVRLSALYYQDSLASRQAPTDRRPSRMIDSRPLVTTTPSEALSPVLPGQFVLKASTNRQTSLWDD